MSNILSTNFRNTISAIDSINTQDPKKEDWQGESYPKELLYSQRMTEMTLAYEEQPSELLQIAARGQHIKRWEIPRSDFPMDRPGYLKWRTHLKLYHAKLLSEIMKTNGYSDEDIKTVTTLVTKQKLKIDETSKKLEDIICLVFLKYYFHDFAIKHPEEKIISIVQKTWKKMTQKGHELALKLTFEEKDKNLILHALN